MDDHREFFSKFPIKILKKGTVIIKPGEILDSVYFIARGNIKQYLITSSGAYVAVHVFSKGSYLPIALILGNRKSRYFFKTVSKTTVHVAESKEVVRWLKKDPRVLYDLTCRLANGLDGMVSRLEGALEQDLHDRLLSLVKYFSVRFAKNGKIRHYIDIPLTHQELAGWLGVSRETVTRAMIQLEKEGILTYSYRKVTFLQN
jgi:CRP-like cAMP-binding protein